MKNIIQTYKETTAHCRDKNRACREMKLSGKERKAKVAAWVRYADKLMCAEKAAKHRVSIRACIAVLSAINKCSFTGDFTNARQKRIATVARYSVRTTGSCIRAMASMGILFTKHQYRGEGKDRRRVASFTIIAAFRNKFDSMKSLLLATKSVEDIEKKLLGFSVSATTASQLKALYKTAKKFKILDTTDGVIKSFDDGIQDVRREYSVNLGGV